MKVAVLTLTRDRLDYTRHCFAALKTNAGCAYDHYVLDQASTDNTVGWLRDQNLEAVHALDDNIGISAGLNYLLDRINLMDYDVVVKVDNDCELTQPNTLRDVCKTVYGSNTILSPRILGLDNPPAATRELDAAGETILDVPQIGGIFLAAPAWWYDDYRYPEDAPKWGMDDVHICRSFRDVGGTCGYVKRLEAWHYLGTQGQRKDQPVYFARKDAEFAGVAA